MDYILFTTSHCPHCPPFKTWVKNNLAKDPAVTGEVLTEKSENFLDRAKGYEIKTAPCLILKIPSKDGCYYRELKFSCLEELKLFWKRRNDNEKLCQKEEKSKEKKEKGEKEKGEKKKRGKKHLT